MLCIGLLGDPSRVYAWTHKRSPHLAGDVLVCAVLDYPDRTTFVDLRWAAIGHTGDRTRRTNLDELRREGTVGNPAIGEDGQIRVAYRDGRRETVPVANEGADERSWRNVLAHFAECMPSGAPCETSGKQNPFTLRLVFDAYCAADSGKAIRHA